MMTDKPLFEHDCDHCVFLGSFEANNVKSDLYYHDCSDPTVIARYSSEGSDYSSSLHSATHNPHLNEAYRRAKELDLVRPEIQLYFEMDNQLRGENSFLVNTLKLIYPKELDLLDQYYDFKDNCEKIQEILFDLVSNEDRAKKFKEEAPKRARQREERKKILDSFLGELEDD